MHPRALVTLVGLALMVAGTSAVADELKVIENQLETATGAMGDGSGAGTEVELPAADCADANEEALDDMSAGPLTGNDPGSAAQAVAIADSPGLSDCLNDLSQPKVPE